MPGTSGRTSVPRKPYDGKKKLCNIVEVRFEHILHTHPFDCGELLVRPGDKLVVEAEKGHQLATAVSQPERRLMDRERLHRVIRRANDRDVHLAEELTEEGRRAARFALGRIRAHQLQMKLVAVEYMLDRSRAVVYFTSDNRVDFRTLVRELAAELRVRIEMRQIGVRDGTGVIGGIGPCGHELCCSTFLRDFGTVAIREPKEQGITLNPQRITGMCSRLKCCLLYEKQSYAEVRPFTPRQDRSVMTAQGPGSIMEIDALARKIQVRFPGGAVESLHMRELIVLDVQLTREQLQATMTREEEVLARRRQKSAGGRVGAQAATDFATDDYLWADVEQKVSFFDEVLEPVEDSKTTAQKVGKRRKKVSSATREDGHKRDTNDRKTDDERGAKASRTNRRSKLVASAQKPRGLDAQGQKVEPRPAVKHGDATTGPAVFDASADSDVTIVRPRRRRGRRPVGTAGAAAPIVDGKSSESPKETAAEQASRRASNSRRRNRRSRSGGGTSGGGTSGGGTPSGGSDA